MQLVGVHAGIAIGRIRFGFGLRFGRLFGFHISVIYRCVFLVLAGRVVARIIGVASSLAAAGKGKAENHQ